MTRHDKIVKDIGVVERLLGDDGSIRAYFDMQGALHTGFGGIKPEEFVRFAKWVKSLAEEEDTDDASR